MQIVHSQTKNHSAESEKSSGAGWRKAVWGKAQKRPQNGKRWTENGLPRARTDVSTYIWQLSKSSRKRPCALPERYTMRPSRPAFRQKGNLSPHSLANRKPQNRWESFIFLHGPTRPQMNDSHGEKLTFWHSVWRSSFTSTTGSLCWSLLKCNTEQRSRDTTKKDRLRIYPEAVLSTLLYRYSLLV